ncbi:hypothetical protein MKW94_025139 [Papaver nudicaule]|uniref:Uncharacterized protein n=1 Tax=Papaver nudicaule TaxID=74823 RepID=A0AA41W2P5_PAPNU|nr:hypothetical protein [Papaver nudicaule]
MSYSPILATPSTSSSKAGAQKHEKQIDEDTKSNSGATSVLRPRAVLSSPGNFFHTFVFFASDTKEKVPLVSRKLETSYLPLTWYQLSEP